MINIIKLLLSCFCKKPTCLFDTENEHTKQQSSGGVYTNEKRPNLFIGSDVSLLFKNDKITENTVGGLAKTNDITISNDKKLELWEKHNSYRNKKLLKSPFESHKSISEEILEQL